MDVSIFDPSEPGFIENPYDQYARIRAASRVQRTPFGQLLVHRYEDCFSMLRHPAAGVDERYAAHQLQTTLPERGRHALLNIDPPDHTRIRRLMSRAFTARHLEGLRPRIRLLVDALVDGLAARVDGGEPAELMSGLAEPLPFLVINELLGMPQGDAHELRTWSEALTRAAEPVQDEASRREIVLASDRMDAYVRWAIEWKRANPADDLLSALVAAEDEDAALSRAELVDQVVMLYVAGHETTVNLIGNGVLALLRHRDQYGRLAEDPSLDESAVDELLRWDCPVQMSRRVVRSEVTVGGERIGPGELVVTLLGAANRDPGHWGPTGDRLDLARDGAGTHLAFGSGIHHCLGAALARMEGAETIGRLVRRLPDLELVSAPRWSRRILFRGLETLEVAQAG